MKHIAFLEGEIKDGGPKIDWDHLPGEEAKTTGRTTSDATGRAFGDASGASHQNHAWLRPLARDTIRVRRGTKGPREKGWPDHIGSVEELDQIVADGDNVGAISGREGGVFILDYDTKYPAHAEILDKHTQRYWPDGWLRSRKGAGKRGRVLRVPVGMGGAIRGVTLNGRTEANVAEFKAWAAGPQHDSPPKPDTNVELRGCRQQTVLYGVHTSGDRYETHATSAFEDLPILDPEKWPLFIRDVQDDLKRIANITFEKDGLGNSIVAAVGERKVDQSTLLADDPEEVVEAYQQWAERRAAQGIHDEHMHHSDFIALLAATKGALGDEMEMYFSELVPYFPGGRDTDERTEYTYASFYDKDVKVGSSRLYQLLDYMPSDTFAKEPTPADEAAMNTPDPEKVARKAALKAAAARYVYVLALDRVWDTDCAAILTASQFNARNTSLARHGAKGEKSAYSEFMNAPGRRTVDSLTYRPGAGLFSNEERDGMEFECANTWRPGVDPRRGAVPEVWLKQGNWLLGEQFTVLCQCLGFMVQNPGVKLGWTPAIIGPQGVGKDALFAPVRHALGAHNVACIDFGRLTDRFNADWAQKQFIIANEAKTSDRRKAADIYNQLKTLFSSMPPTRKIEQKNVAIWYAPNIQVGVILSNHHDAVALERDDRRFGVFQCVPTRKPDNHEDFFAPYFEWCPRDDAPGADAASRRKRAGADVLGYLLDLDVSAFKPETAPETEAKRAMIRAHQPDNAETWVADAFDENGLLHGRDVIAFDEFQGLLRQADHASPNKTLSQLLMRHGFSKREPKIQIGKGGPEKSLWLKNGPGCLLSQLAPAKLAERYLKQSAETQSLVTEVLKSEGGSRW
jgi:hypothetical protein